MQAANRYASAPGFPLAAAPLADDDEGELPPQAAILQAYGETAIAFREPLETR